VERPATQPTPAANNAAQPTEANDPAERFRQARAALGRPRYIQDSAVYRLFDALAAHNRQRGISAPEG
jgi:hypothetical protein